MERLSTKHMNTLLIGTLLALFAAALPAHAQAGDVQRPFDMRYEPWPEKIIEDFSHLPVMNGGRIKPMRTYADYTMLGVRGIRKMSWEHKLASGETRKTTIYPVTFVLDAMIFPEQAEHYPAILVTDSEVLTDLGLGHLAKKKRDRYSYAELRPGFARLEERCQQIMSDPKKEESKNRTRTENQLLDLRFELRRMMSLLGSFTFARARYDLGPGSPISERFGGSQEIGYLDVWAKLPELRKRFDQLSADESQKDSRELQDLRALLGRFTDDSSRASDLRLLPPIKGPGEDATWWTPREITRFTAQRGFEPNPEHGRMLQHLAAMASHRDDLTRFGKELASFRQISERLAAQRGEAGKVGLEVSYINADYFYYSKLAFIFGFLLVAFSWLFTKTRWLWWGAHLLTTAAALYASYGIYVRCILRERPPVSTLYETIIFITTCCVLLGLFMEWVSRRRLALPVAASLGAIGMFVAGKYEASQGVDTMPQLIAVLDTNFWLATHVTTVTIGYAAGLIAGAVGHVYIFAKLFKAWRTRPDIYKNLGRMIYGLLAFGLVFAVVGTILGGIWANDSWGRFWGWDPKENGALLICIYMIATLHARLGGYIRNYGMAICSVAGSAIVAFSWWGVNMLGVGLHSYGFTEGAAWITGFYIAEYVICVLGIYAVMRDRSEARQKLLLERERKAAEKRVREELGGGALQS